MVTDKKITEMKSILTLLGSNFLGLLAAGVFFLCASWSFDLAEMGLYSVAISIHWIVSGILGSGLSVATIRVSTEYLIAGKRGAAAGIVTLAVMITAGISILVVVGFFWGLDLLISEQRFLTDRLLALVTLWAGARSILDILRAGLLAQKQYSRVGLLMVLCTITGLVSLGFALRSETLTVERLLMAHVFGLGAAAIIGSGLLFPLWRSGVNISKRRLWKLLRYARWPALTEGTKMMLANLGPFILIAVAGSDQAGLFSLGRYPAYLFGVIALSLYQYWLPEVSRTKTNEQITLFLIRQMRLAGLIGIGMLFVAVAFRPLLPLLGANFAAAAPLFLLNALDFALFLLVRPIEIVYHGLYKPQLELLLRVARLPLLIGLAFLLATRYGAVGMVWAHVISGFAMLVMAVWLLKRNLEALPYTWNIFVGKQT
jgi:O-antigen/teichoic acid export membrane protein